MQIILAILLGVLFGFALHRVGASNPQKIIGMLRLTDLHLMKVILFAIGLSSLLLFLGSFLNIIDVGHFSIKASYVGVLIGAMILGIGFALAGYCPGTGLAGFAEGRKDAGIFILGGLVGAGLYMFIYQWIEKSFLMKDWGGQLALAPTNEKFPEVISGNLGFGVAILIAILLMLVAWRLPAAVRK